VEGVRRFQQTFKDDYDTKQFNSPWVRPIPDRESNQVFPIRRRRTKPSTAIFSDRHYQQNKIFLSSRGPLSVWTLHFLLNISVSQCRHECDVSVHRMTCELPPVNAELCLFVSKSLLRTDAYEIAKQDSWIAYFWKYWLVKAFDISPQNLNDCVYLCKK